MAQTPNSTCETIKPICTNSYSFISNGVKGSDLGVRKCLGAVSSPSWWYIKIDNPGLLDLKISMTDVNNPLSGIDVDYILYGPFDNLDNVCPKVDVNALPTPKPVGGDNCSFSTSDIEYISINNTKSGEYYILLISNYAGFNLGKSGNIKIERLSTSVATLTCELMNVTPSPCNLSNNSFNLNVNGISQYVGSSFVLKDLESNKSMTGVIPISGTFSFTLNGIQSDGLTHNVSLKIGNQSPLITSYIAPQSCTVITQPCTNCIPSFSPIPGNKYLVSGWVKKSYSASAAPSSYTNVGLNVYYKTTGGETFGDAMITPSGPIIDGWQKMEASFIIPKEAANIVIELVNDDSKIDAFFDDIRVHPYKSNMKSFVYDPSSQKLVAELDENNYATKYEYDDEGILIRVKKETERGIMTIKETRNNQSKLSK